MNRLITVSIFISMMVLNSLAVSLPAIFSDNMVLQRNTQVTIWGHAAPGAYITVSGNWDKTASVVCGDNGVWQCQLQTPEAGGPFTLEIKDKKETITLKNVLVGEVWFCSGQSNMEMPLAGWPPNDPIKNSAEEIANANFPQIRLFTVRRAYATYPQDDCIGEWELCTSQSAKSFSATAYFFGRHLYQELGIPIGLIHSSWGGTPVEAWMAKDDLIEFNEFSDVLSKIEASLDKVEELDNWLESKPKIVIDRSIAWSDLDLKDNPVKDSGYDDSDWPLMQLPQNWEDSNLGVFDGVVWFRKTVKIPENWLGKALILELGPIDDMDITYFNGHKIGGYEQEGFWQTERQYSISPDQNQSEECVIAVRVIDNQGGGGFWGEPQQMKLYLVQNEQDSISLAGEWSYIPSAEYTKGSLYLFDIASSEYLERPKLPIAIGPRTPTCLYNAMVYPVKPFTIKGYIWYQGESNTGNPEQYDYLFPAMIKNWREVWKNKKLSFYYTQIAPYDYGIKTASQRLRESQLKALNVPHTGMAVTLDIGNPSNIHPANKQDVGKRLAFWALAKDYNKNITYSGPLYQSMEVKNNEIIITFSHSGSQLKAKNNQLSDFIIAGEDRLFKKAIARIDGNKVIVSHPEIKNPVAVRYAWSNTAEASLFNDADLPASPFRTDNW